jgi:hypothetical protein
MKAKFYGVVKDGKVVWDNPDICKLWIKRLENKRIEGTFQKEQEDGTDSQRGYYFSCIVRAAVNEGDFAGWVADEIDGYLCKKFLTIDKGTPKERIRSRSSGASFTKEDWSELIDKSIMDMAEHGVIVLPPSKFWGIKK